MVDRKKFILRRYLVALILTILIFLIGVMLGGGIANIKIGKLAKLEREMKTRIMDLELQFLLAEEQPCSSELPGLAEELYQIGGKLNYMERQKGMDDPDVLELKKYYSLLQIRHWLFLKMVKERCKRDLHLILYFYSNEPKKCDRCGDQGIILSYLRKKYPNVRVYSFDVGLDSGAIKTLMKNFDIEVVPTVVVDGKVLHGFQKKEELERLLQGS